MAKEFSRNLRMAEVIQRELALILHQEVKDPRLDMVTVSEVEVSADLAHAKVFVTVFGTKGRDPDVKQNLKILNQMAGFVRSLLGKRIKARIIPELKFIYDNTIIEGNRLAKLIDEAAKDLPKTDDADVNSDTDEKK